MLSTTSKMYLTLLSILIVACSSQSTNNSSKSLPFQTLEHSQNSAITGPRQLVIRDSSNWQSLWREHTANIQPHPAIPNVDFNQHMVIGVFLGERPNLCYQVTIESIEKYSNKKIIVGYKETKPSGGVCAQAIAYPVHLVSVTRSNLTVDFVALD
jgi:protease stability complex PrcB-like protein